MRKRVFAGLSIFVICGLILTACFSPYEGETAVITINFNSNARSSWLHDNLDILSEIEYRVTLDGPTGTHKHIIAPGTERMKFTVASGLWTVKLDAYHNDEHCATGSNSVYVKAGQNNPVTIKMKPVSGENSVDAQTPEISGQPQGAAYKVGATAAAMEVTVAVTDGGTLSYQWYSHNTSSNSGGTIINGAIDASYTPATNAEETVYYYVVVTNTIADNEDGGNKTATTASNTAMITVVDSEHHHEYEWTITIGAAAANNGVETSVQACVCGETTGTPRVSTAGLSYTLINGSTTEYEAAAGTVTSGAVVIASKYEGLPVTAIAEAEVIDENVIGSFVQTAITSVIIPDSVETIGNFAFFGCQNLTSVTIPSSVTTISRGAFALCQGLTSITIPDSVTTISESAFALCQGLTSITIPDSVTSIGDFTFYDCTGLTSIIIPDSITSIGESAFEKCTNLTSVTIGNSVQTICFNAFKDCTSLSNIIIPNSVTTIGDGAFEACTSFTNIIIPNSVTTIGGGAFLLCDNLTSVEIGTGITSIGYRAFDNNNLASVTIYAIEPPTNGDFAVNVFNLTRHGSYFRIKVPAGSVDVYKSAWGIGFYDNLYEAITP